MSSNLAETNDLKVNGSWLYGLLPFYMFDALEWLAAMCSHVTKKVEQVVRCYGYCSNVCRDRRRKATRDALVLCISHLDDPSKGGYRKN
jgi:hypothetical protein